MATNEISPDDPYVRPEGVTDEMVQAVGQVTEALQTVDRARGALYEFHQLIGHADLLLDDAVRMLNEVGHPEMAQVIEKDLIGRNVNNGKWTFQMVDEFDKIYWEFFRHVEHNLRERLWAGKSHLREAEFKEVRRTPGHAHHEARP